MEITLEQIKELRNRTGAGVNAVKDALEKSQGDEEKAIMFLREQGVAKAAKRAERETLNGLFGMYKHTNNRLIVVVEVATETDFAANSADMKEFANNLAVHIAAVGTEYINVDSIPVEILENEKQLFAKDIEGKPAEIAEKILEGKLQKFYKENVLLYQDYFLDDSKTVQDYMSELVAKIGEKVEVSKFVKLQIAGPVSSCGLQ